MLHVRCRKRLCVTLHDPSGDRLLTPWLTVLGKNVEGMPLVEVLLRKAGDELRGVRARVSRWQRQHTCLDSLFTGARVLACAVIRCHHQLTDRFSHFA